MTWNGLQAIYDFLLDMQNQLMGRDPQEVLELARAYAEALKSPWAFEDLRQEDFDPFAARIQDMLKEVLDVCEAQGFQSLYFEYHLDSNWTCGFYGCLQDASGDEEVLADWQSHFPCGTFPEIGALYPGVFAGTPEVVARNMSLVACTTARFAQEIDVHQERLERLGLKVFVGFHGQTPVTWVC